MDPKKLSDVTRATDAHGCNVAKPETMDLENEAVALIKQYSVPQTAQPHDSDDTLRHAKVDIGFLRSELKRIKSRCARLENEIQSEVKMLTAALNGEQETYDQVKRRISRLKGSLEYPGHE